MDITERSFKVGLDLILFLVVVGILSTWFGPLLAIGLGLVVAHTLNFVFNGQIWCVVKHFDDVQLTKSEFDQEVERLRVRATHEPYIVYAAAYGSLARDQWSPTSDLDVRLIRAPGVRSALRVCWFAMRERARAFWIKFPLDIFVLDGYESLNKLAEKNFPVILHSTDLD